MGRTPQEILKDAKKLGQMAAAKSVQPEVAVQVLFAHVEELAEALDALRHEHARDVIELRQGIVNAQRAILNELDKRLPNGKDTLIQETNPGPD